jgi:SPP1 family predicted phage head-tail adaptor
MQLGALDQQITLQTLTTARDATYGEAVQTFSDAYTTWAEIKYRAVSVPEPEVAGQKQATVRISIRMRYYDGMNTKMRVKHGTRFYQVLDYWTVGRNEETRINASEWNEGRR